MTSASTILRTDCGVSGVAYTTSLLISQMSEIDLAPTDPVGSVYVLMDGDEVVYIGSTKSVSQRVSLHQSGDRRRPAKRFDRAFSLAAPSTGWAATTIFSPMRERSSADSTRGSARLRPRTRDVMRKFLRILVCRLTGSLRTHSRCVDEPSGHERTARSASETGGECAALCPALCGGLQFAT